MCKEPRHTQMSLSLHSAGSSRCIWRDPANEGELLCPCVSLLTRKAWRPCFLFILCGHAHSRCGASIPCVGGQHLGTNQTYVISPHYACGHHAPLSSVAAMLAAGVGPRFHVWEASNWTPASWDVPLDAGPVAEAAWAPPHTPELEADADADAPQQRRVLLLSFEREAKGGRHLVALHFVGKPPSLVSGSLCACCCSLW